MTELPHMLRAMLHSDMRGSLASGELDARTQSLLASACAEAKRQELRAEQLLILLKEESRKQPQGSDEDRRIANIALSRLVTLCIKEYYKPASAG